MIPDKWKFFIGSCILGGSMLHSAGAPLVPMIIGFAIGGLITWLRQ